MRTVLALSCSRRLLFLVVAFHLAVSILGMVAKNNSGGKKRKQLQPSELPSEEGWKSSPATTSIQDHQRVQEILKDRLARRQPRLEELQPTFQTSDYDYDESDRSVESSMWLSLPRRPKKNTIQIRTAASTTTRATIDTNGINIPFESTLQALQAFYLEHSHLVLPRRYLVPESASYPSTWHGVDLAGTVYNMRWWQHHVQNQPDRVSELNKIGFVWERLQPEWNLILESLIVYKSLNGNVMVPSTFVVPYDDDRWPEACWGISLGNSVYKIRNRGDHLGGRNPNAWSRRQQLDALGFVWDVEELRFSKFSSALELFAKIEQLEQQPKTIISSSPTHSGALKVPSQFVVPRISQWPNELWGYRLGERCTQVRQKELYIKGQPLRIKILADLGFYVTGGSNSNLRWLEVVHAAAVYSQKNNKKLDVPTNFVVPAPPRRVAVSSIGDETDERTDDLCVVGSDDAWPWPEYLWGFPLGQRLRDIRVKGYYMKGKNTGARRRQLDALGFNWEPKRGRPRGKD